MSENPAMILQIGRSARSVSDGDGRPVAELRMTAAEFQLFRALIYEGSGITLGHGKLELVRGRLAKRLRKLGIKTFREYYDLVTDGDLSGQELITAIDLITTNKTDMFRERDHFTLIEKVILPEKLEAARGASDRRLRCWCAACSTGEEPYSLALTLLANEEIRAKWDVKILATDLSTRVLRTAMEGIYEEEKLQPVPAQQLTKYFTPHGPGRLQVSPELRKLVTFRQFNLVTGSVPTSGTFDILMCRNVMIYFDEATKAALVARLAQLIKPGGYFFVGMAESLQRNAAGLTYVQPSVYRK